MAISYASTGKLGYDLLMSGQRVLVGLANSLQTLVVAEMLAANEGLGFLIINSRISLSTELAYVAIFLLGVIGFLADSSFRAFTARVAWKYKLV